MTWQRLWCRRWRMPWKSFLGSKVRECGVWVSCSSNKGEWRTTRYPPSRFNRSPSENPTIVSIRVDCWSYVPTSFTVYRDSQSPYQRDNDPARRLETIHQFNTNLLQLGQLNCAPFTYWSNLKAKEFIWCHCWHFKLSTISVLIWTTYRNEKI